MARTFALLLAVILACGRFITFDQTNATQFYFTIEQDEKPDNSNLILASLHSLMKSWSQAYAPHGHALLPVTIKPGTLLYHMGAKPPPTGLNWFA